MGGAPSSLRPRTGESDAARAGRGLVGLELGDGISFGGRSRWIRHGAIGISGDRGGDFRLDDL